jgi:hypothetical protein
VLLLDSRTFARSVELRPSTTVGKTLFTYTGVNPGMATAQAQNLLARSYTITADVEAPQGGGDRMIVTRGRRWGGYRLCLLKKKKPVFDYKMLILAQYRWEGQEPLSAAEHSIVFDCTCDGPSIAKGGTGVLKVDGQVVECAGRHRRNSPDRSPGFAACRRAGVARSAVLLLLRSCRSSLRVHVFIGLLSLLKIPSQR